MISWNTGQKKKKGMVKKMIYEIQKDSADFKNVEFCYKALTKSKKDPRKHLHHFLIANGFIHSTDGKRLHKVKPVQEFEEGHYRPFKAEPGFVLVKVEEFDYPNLEDIIPEENPDKVLEITLIDLDASFAEIIRSLPDEQVVNHLFVKDLLDNHFELKLYFDKGVLVFSATDGNKVAVLMVKKA